MYIHVCHLQFMDNNVAHYLWITMLLTNYEHLPPFINFVIRKVPQKSRFNHQYFIPLRMHGENHKEISSKDLSHYISKAIQEQLC